MINTIAKKNDHISIEELSALLEHQLSCYAAKIGCKVSLEPLGRKKPIEDTTTVVLVRGAKGRPQAVINCSRSSSPDLIMRGVEAAKSISKMIGEQLGTAIIRPISQGYIAGRSYVMLPWYREIPKRKPHKLWYRMSLRRPILNWLSQATASTAATHKHSAESALAFDNMLQHLIQQNFVDSDKRNAIKKSLKRLENGKWQPRHTFDHNDLWLGNIMLSSQTRNDEKNHYPFVLIDWAGANHCGYGIYDLIRLSRGLRLSPKSLRKQLVAHSLALKCELKDTKGHLLSAFGRLHQHLEYFPEDRFVDTFQACWSTMSNALPE